MTSWVMKINNATFDAPNPVLPCDKKNNTTTQYPCINVSGHVHSSEHLLPSQSFIMVGSFTVELINYIFCCWKFSIVKCSFSSSPSRYLLQGSLVQCNIAYVIIYCIIVYLDYFIYVFVLILSDHMFVFQCLKHYTQFKVLKLCNL